MHKKTQSTYSMPPQKRKNSPAGFLVFALVVLAVIAFAVNALTKENNVFEPEPLTYPAENFMWDSNNRPTYFEEGAYTSELGVDVSEHNGEFDWHAAANDGMSFAFIRLGWRGYSEGILHVDEYFTRNYLGARSEGFDVGVYFFSSAINEAEAVEEAEFVLAQLSDIGAQLELPIVFDHERVSASNGRANNLSNAQASAIANAFCARIEAAGYQTMIYGNLRDLGRYNEDVTATREVWLAEYETHVPAARFPFSFWQYTDAGHINGINRNVDISIRFVPVETAQ